MKRPFSILILAFLLTDFIHLSAQNTDDFYNEVKTYVNPVLPGDHPDPTMLKVGDDFYHCGSSFHFTPYLPIYHSKDMVHWQVISRVVPPSVGNWVTDRPSAGIWQGAITYFYGSFWIYFSSNGQWFSKAETPFGPWTTPVKVEPNAKTGPLGYDNAIFVDDDGKPYMVIKNGQKTNRLQELGKDGQLTSSVINLDWINANLQYSWAEGPVMCKRNGFYYYFPAGDVSGGQYAMRGTALTSDSTKWERLGEFFKPITDPKTGFKRPNHISAPFQLADGSWWTIGQSYEKYEGDDWSGMGRQTSLFPVIWEGDRPWGMAPTTQPIVKPNLPKGGILWRSADADYFEKDSLSLNWHFLKKRYAKQISLTDRKGWIRLLPDSFRTSIVQKETDHYYSAVTKVDVKAKDTTKAGIYLSSGNQAVNVRLYSGFDKEKKIFFRFEKTIFSIPNTFGDMVWLKMTRKQHEITAFASGDGKNWTKVGESINVANLDKTQPNYNSWVGTSLGIFTEGVAADFDFFLCKDAFTELPAVGFSNYYGVEKGDEAVTNTSEKGGWFMISGIEMGRGKSAVKKIALQAAATKGGHLDIWLDDFKTGRKIATLKIKATGGKNTWKTFSKSIKNVSGKHDLFIKYTAGTAQDIYVKTVVFK